MEPTIFLQGLFLTNRNTGRWAWYLSTPGQVSGLNTSGDQLDYWAITTTATSGNVQYVGVGESPNSGSGPLPNLSDRANWYFQWRFQLASTASIGLRIGITTVYTAIANPVSYIGLRFDTATDTNFRFVTRSASAETDTDSGTVADTSWHTLEVYCTTAGTIKFRLDDGTEQSSSTNINTGAFWQPTVVVVTNTTAAKTANVDRFGFVASSLNR